MRHLIRLNSRIACQKQHRRAPFVILRACVKLLNEQMLAILEWAAEHPKRWHDTGKMPEPRKAAELPAKRGSSRFETR